jgi:hypothetical protein
MPVAVARLAYKVEETEFLIVSWHFRKGQIHKFSECSRKEGLPFVVMLIDRILTAWRGNNLGNTSPKQRNRHEKLRKNLEPFPKAETNQVMKLCGFSSPSIAIGVCHVVPLLLFDLQNAETIFRDSYSRNITIFLSELLLFTQARLMFKYNNNYNSFLIVLLSEHGEAILYQRREHIRSHQDFIWPINKMWIIIWRSHASCNLLLLENK